MDNQTIKKRRTLKIDRPLAGQQARHPRKPVNPATAPPQPDNQAIPPAIGIDMTRNRYEQLRREQGNQNIHLHKTIHSMEGNIPA